jgi:hypothetical protein
MKKTLMTVIGMTVLCVHSNTLKKGRKTTGVLRVLFCSFLCSCGTCVNLSADSYEPPERAAKRQAIEAHIARIYSEFGDDALPELYKVLEENIEDGIYVAHIVEMFDDDAYNPTVASDAEALKIMRKAVDAKGWGKEYLMRKGDTSDLERLPDTTNEIIRYSARATLKARVEGVNVMRFLGVGKGAGVREIEPYFMPSAANLGPQAVYVCEILRRYWQDQLKIPVLTRETVRYYGEQSEQTVSKMPEELLKIVVWFDEEGNPVCNIDLSKYGLSMPVIEPKPIASDPKWYMQPTVTFPHDTDGWTPPTPAPKPAPPPPEPEPLPPPVEAPPPAEPENKTTPWKLPLLIGSLVLIGAVVVWRYIRRNKS